jgi:anti-anti-sigma factor
MSVDTKHLKHCDLIEAAGRFDSSTSAELETVLRASIDSGVFRIVLDMDQVDYFGSAALRTLIVAYKECRRWNRGDVRLCRVPERVRRVLDLAGILPLVQTFDDPVLAVGSF